MAVSTDNKMKAVTILLDYCLQCHKDMKQCMSKCPIIKAAHMLQKEIYLDAINEASK